MEDNGHQLWTFHGAFVWLHLTPQFLFCAIIFTTSWDIECQRKNRSNFHGVPLSMQYPTCEEVFCLQYFLVILQPSGHVRRLTSKRYFSRFTCLKCNRKTVLNSGNSAGTNSRRPALISKLAQKSWMSACDTTVHCDGGVITCIASTFTQSLQIVIFVSQYLLGHWPILLYLNMDVEIVAICRFVCQKWFLVNLSLSLTGIFESLSVSTYI